MIVGIGSLGVFLVSVYGIQCLHSLVHEKVIGTAHAIIFGLGAAMWFGAVFSNIVGG